MVRPAVSERLRRHLGHALVRADPVLPADAAVILGGAPRYRAPTAIRLLRAGTVGALVAVGGGRDALEAHRTARFLARQGVSPARVVVLTDPAPGTAEEAARCVRLAAERGWRRLLVVTSPYHTWRAGQLFDRRARRVGVAVGVVPATDDPYDPDGWWRHPVQRRLVRNEVLKHAWWTLTLRRR